MTKSIHTLVSDIYNLVGGPDGITTLPSNLGANVANAVASSLGPRQSRGLRLSGLGPYCQRQLWFKINHPELEEALPPYAKIKYCYGHIIEHLIIALAKAAGHTVVGEQDELILDGITGHRDCVIDGCIVDVKSAATRSFLKFSQKTIAEDDSFGYLDQLDGYAVASLDDPLVTTKDHAYILAVDKQLGHLALYDHRIRTQSIKERIIKYKQVVELPSPPPCECGVIDDGEGGNIKLDVKSSYNTFKHQCFPRLRTFLYSGGPQYFTRVVKIPKYKGIPLTEIDKHGKLVYNYG